MSKIILTGIKPTGTGELHLGNYVGAVRPIMEYAENPEHEVYLFIADYHSLINQHDPKIMRENSLRMAANLISCCNNKDNVHIYLQSDIPEILELNFILSCFTAKGLMNRAHAYKAACDKNSELGRSDLDDGINMGLYTYPILMAADILIFQPDFVPVGQDQKQHLEIARDICSRINHNYKSNLKLPSPIISKDSGTIPGLDGRKMSKSYNNIIPLFSTEKRMQKLINKIKTDSKEVNEPKDHSDSSLYELYTHFSTKPQQEKMQQMFAEGAGYGDIKKQVFATINNEITDYREIYNSLLENPESIHEKLNNTAIKIRPRAQEFIKILRDKIGINY
jgi:tryptophanyl-tRNA synthetase